MLTRNVWLIVLVCGVPAAAQNKVFDDVRDQVFWRVLYANGGETLYWAAEFEAGRRKVGGRSLSLEHVYPANWLVEHYGCPDRKTCKDPVLSRTLSTSRKRTGRWSPGPHAGQH